MSKEFIKDAIRTKSNQFHGDKVSEEIVREILEKFIYQGEYLDDLKKKLFYNKETQRIALNPKKPAKAWNIEDYSNDEIDIIHGITGVATESVELCEALIARMNSSSFDVVNIKEEIGDIFWYLAILANATGFSFEEIQDTVIRKLKARYPDKFTSESAMDRNLEAERKILEESA